jgi:hypothetical protein
MRVTLGVETVPDEGEAETQHGMVTNGDPLARGKRQRLFTQLRSAVFHDFGEQRAGVRTLHGEHAELRAVVFQLYIEAFGLTHAGDPGEVLERAEVIGSSTDTQRERETETRARRWR